MAVRMEPDERRKSILATAMSIIDEHGHQGLTMRALARACGMSAPGLMHYFPDMPTLVVAVIDYREQRDADLYDLSMRGPGVTRMMLDKAIQNIIDRPKAAELFAIVEAQAIDPRHPGHEYFKYRNERLVADVLPIASAEYENAEELIRQLIAIADGLQLNWLRDPGSFDLMERWKAIADPLLAAAERCDVRGAEPDER